MTKQASASQQAEDGSKRVYAFEDGDGRNKQLLGGKGANLCEMTQIGLNVPPGFVITTDVCLKYLDNNRGLPRGLMDEVRSQMHRIEQQSGRRFGNPSNPLLVSVRSGSALSMPGMMDTILNLGLNPETLQGLIRQTGNERFAYDAYRRFVQLFGKVALGVPDEKFDEQFAEVKQRAGVKVDVGLSSGNLKEIGERFLRVVREHTGRDFPTDVFEQLEIAVKAVFNSWMGKRAVDYRAFNKITPAMANGTAVNVVAMVFGNMGLDSATGVGFTRDPGTGENAMYGEYLTNAQGEDVVAGIRTPRPVAMLAEEMPDLYRQLVVLRDKLESHYREVQDYEYTIEKGVLYCLQTRNGKMNATAMVRSSVEMVKEGLITREQALLRVKPDLLEQLLHRRLDPAHKADALVTGLPASPGAASGQCVFDADRAEILGKPCVAGAEGITVDVAARQARIGDTVLHEGDVITIEGGTGKVFAGEIPTIEPEFSDDLRRLLSWADEIAKLKVLANADTPEGARKAVEMGAMGIGLCRTERMFNAADRLPIVVEMILAESPDARGKSLDRLLPIQRRDFEEIFKAMSPRPVTIRLLDPPIHEFLPTKDELVDELQHLGQLRNDVAGVNNLLHSMRLLRPESTRMPDTSFPFSDDGAKLIAEAIAKKELMLRKVKELHEVNPMLGHRGVRLGITYPEIYAMQIRAILEAAARCAREGIEVHPEIMVPQVCTAQELIKVKEHVDELRREIAEKAGITVQFKFGTMIEVVRACMRAEQLATVAEFFSFGTNDLTQATFSFSREDAENKFLPFYNQHHILQDNPFEVLDVHGVGRLMEIAVDWGRRSRPDLTVGICGEQGGHPDSIRFCHRIGLDYVSCSSPRVPIARLAAAQAALLEIGERGTSSL